MKDYKIEVANALSDLNIALNIEEIYKFIEIPPDKQMGDYAFPCFVLAKELKKAPNIIAQELADQIDLGSNFEKALPMGPYINFFINREDLIRNVIQEIEEKKEAYGSSDLGDGKNVIVEYSSTNIAKPFHIGHIRSTLIGNVIKKVYDFLGYDTVAINYIGDHGTQFGMMIAAYKLWGDDQKLKEDPIGELLRLYVKYNDLAEEDEGKMEEARYWFRELENKNPEALELWNWFKDLSLEEFDRVYEMLGVEFDSYNGEAYSSQFVDQTLELLREKDLLVKDDGAEIVEIEDEGLTNPIITKSDGTSTYIVRDISTAIYRKDKYDFYKNIYVVASQQNLHFQQLFTVLEKMGYPWAKECVHVNFGMVSLRDQTLSTRRGQVVFLEDVLNSAIEKTRDIIEERNPGLEDKERVSREVGIGAIIFQELYNSRIKDYVFDWDEVLSFEGETGPYLQYTIARANSILERAGQLNKGNIDYSLLTSDEEYYLAKALYYFPEKLIDAHDKYEPSYVARQLIEIAQTFNRFYNACPILNQEDESVKKARLSLLEATRDVLRNGLGLLGIKSPEKM